MIFKGCSRQNAESPAVDLPDLDIIEIDWPEIDWPEIDWPDLEITEIDWTEIVSPDLEIIQLFSPDLEKPAIRLKTASKIIPTHFYCHPRSAMPRLHRISVPTIFFSHQLQAGVNYCPRTGNEQQLAEVYQNQHNDDITMDKKATVVIALLVQESKKQDFANMIDKYSKLSEDHILYKLFKIESQKVKVLARYQHSISSPDSTVITISSDNDEGNEKACMIVPRSKQIQGLKEDLEQNLGGMDRKKQLLRRAFLKRMRVTLVEEDVDEIRAMVVNLRKILRTVQQDNREEKIAAFGMSQRIFFMNVLVAEETIALRGDKMCCPILLKVMLDPVTTSLGHTYERARYLFSCMR